MLKTIPKIANHANPRGQAHGLSPEDRRWAARWVERSIDGRVLEATRERGQQVGEVPNGHKTFSKFLAQFTQKGKLSSE